MVRKSAHKAKAMKGKKVKASNIKSNDLTTLIKRLDDKVKLLCIVFFEKR
jgi:hypothetical protein